MAKQEVLFKAKLLESGLEVISVVLRRACGLADDKTASSRHALIALPSGSWVLDGIRSMH